MARATIDIYNGMVAETQGFAQLGGYMPQFNLAPPNPDNPFTFFINQINNGSKVAIWLLFIWMVAQSQHTLEVLWDNMKADMNTIASQSIAGTLPWYYAQAKAWQFGYALIWNAATYRYYYTDTTSTAAVASRIIYSCSVQEVVNIGFDGVLFKVAKNIGTADAPVLAPLDSTPGSELQSFTSYINDVKFAGIQTSIVSLPPDLALLNLNIYYDGTLDLPAFQTAVLAGINNYFFGISLSATANVQGIFYVQDLIDAIKAVPGVKQDPQVISIECRPSTGAYVNVPYEYNPASGYFVIDAGSTINYLPL